MGIFHKIFESLLSEDNTASSAFGVNASGEYGNQFPSQNSKAYNPNDNRPINPLSAILGSKKRKNKTKFKIARRALAPM
jgi:hypothetical protein